MSATFTKDDTPDSLSTKQLELMASSDHGFLARFLEEETRFDAHRVRLMLELGAAEAKRRLAAPSQPAEPVAQAEQQPTEEDCTLCDGMGIIDGIGATGPHCDGNGIEPSHPAAEQAATEDEQ